MDAPVTICPRCGSNRWMDRPYRLTSYRPDGKGEWHEYEVPPPAHPEQVCQTCWEQDHGRPKQVWRDGEPVNKRFSPTGWP